MAMMEVYRCVGKPPSLIYNHPNWSIWIDLQFLRAAFLIQWPGFSMYAISVAYCVSVGYVRTIHHINDNKIISQIYFKTTTWVPTKKTNVYKNLTDKFVIKHLMGYYLSEFTSFNSYCNKHAISSKRVSLLRVIKAVNLEQHKVDKTLYSFVHNKIVRHIESKKGQQKTNMDKLHESNRSLTSDEVNVLVSTCTCLACMGLGIDTNTCLLLVNQILAKIIDAKEFVPATLSVVTRIMLSNHQLLHLVKGNSINPKRVRQADVDVKMAMFVKLDSMIKLLHSQGNVPWKSFGEVPPECLYNMDELAVNAHNHRHRIIAPVSDYFEGRRLYQETGAGDNKIPFHVTIALTTCAKGKFMLLELIFYYGLNYFIHNTHTK